MSVVANTFTQIYIQIVFAVAGCECLLRRENKEELHKYITGIVRNNGQKLIEINSVSDHIHILIGLKPSLALSELVKDIKSELSGFISGKRWVRGRFHWQEGYGAFSYSHSHLNAVVRYIRNQERHHSVKSFRDEYMTLLRKFDVAFDERYVFNFIEGD